MRREHHLVHPEQRRVGRGLDREDVERGAGQPAVLERLRERVLVDDAAARGVHEPGTLLHHRELVLPDQPPRVRGAREVDRDEVGLHQERLERRHHVYAQLLGSLAGDVRVERDHAHPEGLGPRGDERPDPAEPDQAEGLARELHALPPILVPTSGVELAVRLGDVPSLREEQRHRVLRRADRVRLRRVHDHHATARGGLDVDVVDADAGTRHHLQVGRGVEDLSGHAGRAPDHERVVPGDRAGEVAAREIFAHVDLEPFAEQIQTRLGELLGDEHPHPEAAASWKTPSADATAAPRFTGYPSRSRVISSAASPRTMSSSLK